MLSAGVPLLIPNPKYVASYKDKYETFDDPLNVVGKLISVGV